MLFCGSPGAGTRQCTWPGPAAACHAVSGWASSEEEAGSSSRSKCGVQPPGPCHVSTACCRSWLLLSGCWVAAAAAGRARAVFLFGEAASPLEADAGSASRSKAGSTLAGMGFRRGRLAARRGLGAAACFLRLACAARGPPAPAGPPTSGRPPAAAPRAGAPCWPAPVWLALCPAPFAPERAKATAVDGGVEVLPGSCWRCCAADAGCVSADCIHSGCGRQALPAARCSAACVAACAAGSGGTSGGCSGDA